ncbi:MAG TPA: hypothetical protein VFE61_22475 [Candidatus Sulfotelmatobacter sp.]|jgi:hypothetical protein|nr:hypothetical protein [Candidatus Sulfotelmatobacter sp.]
MTFSVFLEIFHPPSFGCFEEIGLFQHPQDFPTTNEDPLFAKTPTTHYAEGHPMAAEPEEKHEVLEDAPIHGGFGGICEVTYLLQAGEKHKTE